MASSVIVLTPNGRRQTVKVTPNTTILQIIEEVCVKQELKPEEFDIKHHRKILDATTTIRFSGLPNNAALELVKATTLRKETEVVLGVQLENGERLMGNFLPSANLWDVVNNLCPQQLQPNLVVLYMRQEIHGLENMKQTNLKSLGLTSGRAMLRLLHRNPEELKQQANVSAPLPVKPVEEKPYVRQLKRVTPEKTVTPEISAHVPNRVPDQEDVQKPESGNSDEFRATPPRQRKDDSNILAMIKQEKRKQTEGIKVKNTSQPTETVKECISEEYIFLGARNAMLFSLETAQTVRSDDLPDDFYELSVGDVKKLFKDIKKRRLEMENGTLRTAAMRDLEKSTNQLRQLNKYKKAIIRILFPSRLVLQGIFTPTETVNDVQLFVKEYLEDKNMPFYLFTTPPKIVLDNDTGLLEANCVPGALLHFGTEEKGESYLRQDILGKVSSTAQASAAATKIRTENTRQVGYATEDPDVTSILETGSEVNAGASTSIDYNDYESKPVHQRTSPEKVPKWFKPTK